MKEGDYAMVEILEEKGELITRIGGQEYARYQFGAPRWKPYLFPIRAGNGLSLVADAPTDHRNHHGFWVGHGRVDDTDCWLERHNSGTIAHQSFENVTSGGDMASFTEHCHWLATSGSVVLTDTRTFIFYDMPSEGRIFDFDITLQSPDDRAISLHPTNEAGIPHIRMAEGLTVKTGGVMLNSEGRRNERETYRQRAAWLDCSGKLGRLACGLAVFDHPKNPAFPTPWFTRDYGPFSPNFGFFDDEPIVITPTEPLRLRYRIYTHSGNAEEGRVQQAWEMYLASAGGAPLTLQK